MYSNVHGVIGAITVATTYVLTKNETIALTLGMAIAFLLHNPTDYLGEKGYGSMKITLIYEIVPYIIFWTCAYFSGIWYLYILGWIAGNGMDLWDKKLYLSVFLPKKFPVRKDFSCHRRSSDKIIQFTLQQTKDATIICSIVLIIFTYFIWKN
jgi:hypothetical protein